MIVVVVFVRILLSCLLVERARAHFTVVHLIICLVTKARKNTLDRPLCVRQRDFVVRGHISLVCFQSF